MPITTLGDISEIFAGKPATRLKPGTDEVPMLTMRNIEDGLSTSGEMDRISANLKEASRFAVRAGDLIASVRGTFKVAVIAAEHEGGIAGANTAVIRFRDQIPGAPVAAYLRHPDVTDRLQKAFVGSTVPGISLDELRATPIELPDLKRLWLLANLVEAGETYYSAARDAAEKRRQLMFELVRTSLSGTGEAE